MSITYMAGSLLDTGAAGHRAQGTPGAADLYLPRHNVFPAVEARSCAVC